MPSQRPAAADPPPGRLAARLRAPVRTLCGCSMYLCKVPCSLVPAQKASFSCQPLGFDLSPFYFFTHFASLRAPAPFTTHRRRPNKRMPVLTQHPGPDLACPCSQTVLSCPQALCAATLLIASGLLSAHPSTHQSALAAHVRVPFCTCLHPCSPSPQSLLAFHSFCIHAARVAPPLCRGLASWRGLVPT